MEHQTHECEALRHDDKFTYVANWKFTGEDSSAELIKEELKFEAVELKTRNYK
jgi:succinate dehydrogenase / fumarate reductase flavoprotein subunit